MRRMRTWTGQHATIREDVDGWRLELDEGTALLKDDGQVYLLTEDGTWKLWQPDA